MRRLLLLLMVFERMIILPCEPLAGNEEVVHESGNGSVVSSSLPPSTIEDMNRKKRTLNGSETSKINSSLSSSLLSSSRTRIISSLSLIFDNFVQSSAQGRKTFELRRKNVQHALRLKYTQLKRKLRHLGRIEAQSRRVQTPEANSNPALVNSHHPSPKSAKRTRRSVDYSDFSSQDLERVQRDSSRYKRIKTFTPDQLEKDELYHHALEKGLVIIGPDPLSQDLPSMLKVNPKVQGRQYPSQQLNYLYDMRSSKVQDSPFQNEFQQKVQPETLGAYDVRRTGVQSNSPQGRAPSQAENLGYYANALYDGSSVVQENPLNVRSPQNRLSQGKSYRRSGPVQQGLQQIRSSGNVQQTSALTNLESSNGQGNFYQLPNVRQSVMYSSDSSKIPINALRSQNLAESFYRETNLIPQNSPVEVQNLQSDDNSLVDARNLKGRSAQSQNLQPVGNFMYGLKSLNSLSRIRKDQQVQPQPTGSEKQKLNMNSGQSLMTPLGDSSVRVLVPSAETSAVAQKPMSFINKILLPVPTFGSGYRRGSYPNPSFDSARNPNNVPFNYYQNIPNYQQGYSNLQVNSPQNSNIKRMRYVKPTSYSSNIPSSYQRQISNEKVLKPVMYYNPNVAESKLDNPYYVPGAAINLRSSYYDPSALQEGPGYLNPKTVQASEYYKQGNGQRYQLSSQTSFGRRDPKKQANYASFDGDQKYSFRKHGMGKSSRSDSSNIDVMEQKGTPLLRYPKNWSPGSASSLEVRPHEEPKQEQKIQNLEEQIEALKQSLENFKKNKRNDYG